MASKPPPIWHYIPNAGYRTVDASRYVGTLVAAILPWILKLQQSGKPMAKRFQFDDEVRCALAGALSRAVEWDGFLIAHELKLVTAWPSDAELVQLIHRWSCDLKTSTLNAWRERQARAAE